MMCELCTREFKTQRGLNTHLRFSHDILIAEYYEVFHPIYCIECGKIVPYKNDGHYKNYKFCSKNCLKKAYSKKEPRKNFKYKKEFLLDELRRLHEKYGGFVTQNLVRLNGVVLPQIYYNYFESFVEACELAQVPYFKRIINKKEPIEDSLIPIIIDTREQRPYRFKNYIKKKLDVGDYTLDMGVDVRIERKSIPDLKGTLGFGLNRFKKELQRARDQNLYVVILIDGTEKLFWKTAFFGKMSPKSLFHNLKLLSGQYADVCQFVFTGGRIKSAKLVYFLCLIEKEDLQCSDIQDLLNRDLFMDHFFGES